MKAEEKHNTLILEADDHDIFNTAELEERYRKQSRVDELIAEEEDEIEDNRTRIGVLKSEIRESLDTVSYLTDEYNEIRDDINEMERRRDEFFRHLEGNVILKSDIPGKVWCTYDPSEIARITDAKVDYLLMQFDGHDVRQAWGGQGYPHNDAEIFLVCNGV